MPSIIPSLEQVDAQMQQKQRQEFIDEIKTRNLEKLTPGTVDDNFKYLKTQTKTWKDEEYDFNGHMERAIPFSFKTEDLTSTQDITEIVIERGSLSSSQIGNISEEKIIEAVGNVVQITGISTVGPFNLANNTGVSLTSTLTDNQDANRIMMGIFEVDCFQDSIASNNQIPYGTNTINAEYKVFTDFDITKNLNSDNPYSGITALHQVYNQAGEAHNLYWRTRWRYIGRKSAS
jgi:hypothetical protein